MVSILLETEIMIRCCLLQLQRDDDDDENGLQWRAYTIEEFIRRGFMR